MAAPTGNKNAQRWTLQKTIDTLNFIDMCSFNDDCLYLGDALTMAGYYTDLWGYWRRKWREKYEVVSLMKTIMQRFESRIFRKMANKEIPAQVGMFALRHHYGWGKDPMTIPVEDNLYLLDVADLEEETDALPDTDQAPAADTEQQEIIKEAFAGIRVPPNQVLGKEFTQKLHAYNLANPQKHLGWPACYFMGEPPADLPGIPFDGGYFLTLQI